MKKLMFFLMQVIMLQVATAQSPAECRRVASLAIESINSKSTESLKEHLSDDFSMAGQQGEIAKLVLDQLLIQLGDTVKTYNEIELTELDEGLEMKFNIEYAKKGIREATFFFNKDNLLQELSLFKMEVKTMNKASNVINNSKDVFEIPFTLAGKLILVDVVLNGKERKFILDSGAPRVILNASHVVKDSTKAVISSASTEGVGGSISGMDIEKVASLNFGGIQLIDEELLTIDLAHLEKELECEFYGLIGFELIKDYDIIFDYENQILTFIATNAFEKYKSKNLSNSKLEKIPFQLEGHIPVIQAEINDEVLTFGLDSGAESNLIDDDLFDALKKSTCQIEIDELMGADNNKREVKKSKIKRMTIGNKTFKKLETYFSDISHLNKGYNLSLDGLIGYPVLSQQKTLISFERKELMFIE